MLREFHFAGTSIPQTSVNPSATVPFPVNATFVISVNLLRGRRASARLTRFLHYFVPVNIFHRNNVPHASLFRRRDVCESVSSFDRWYEDENNGAGEEDAVSATSLGPSPGRSGDGAVRHRVEEEQRGCVSVPRRDHRVSWTRLLRRVHTKSGGAAPGTLYADFVWRRTAPPLLV